MTGKPESYGNLRVSCECGRWLPIEADAAGSSINCPCGGRVLVPSLEEFRDRPDLISAATLERRVHRLIKVGELPPGGGCARCGVADAAVVAVELECERYSARASGGERFLIIPLFSFALWMWWREEERVEIRGRDTDVSTPIRLCGSCQRSLHDPPRWIGLALAASVLVLAVLAGLTAVLAGLAAPAGVAIGVGVAAIGLLGLGLWRRLQFRSRQRELKELLQQVPVYRQVLARYRRAIVVVPEDDTAYPSPPAEAREPLRE